MAVRTRHYSLRTEETYVGWARRFILFHGKKHPSAMGAEEVNAFLTHLAVETGVSASTQGQALSALLFEVRPVDPVSLAAAVALLAGVSVVASWLPARRAANTNPAQALRAD